MDPELIKKKREYEARKTRTKLALNICTICGKKDARPCKGCGTTAYCSTDCQRIDWRDRGHRKVCKKIQAAEAARAEAPTPPPSPPREVVYGPAPRSHADEVRARRVPTLGSDRHPGLVQRLAVAPVVDELLLAEGPVDPADRAFFGLGPRSPQALETGPMPANTLNGSLLEIQLPHLAPVREAAAQRLAAAIEPAMARHLRRSRRPSSPWRVPSPNPLGSTSARSPNSPRSVMAAPSPRFGAPSPLAAFSSGTGSTSRTPPASTMSGTRPPSPSSR